MYKKIFFLFFIFFNFAFAELSEIQKIRFGEDKLIFDIKGNLPKYTISFDEENMMVFLEFLDSIPSSDIKNVEVDGNYIKTIETISFENTTDFFITLKKGVKYRTKTLSNPERFFFEFEKSENKKQYVIAIDAGHGGKDPGAVNGKIFEKDIVLKVANFLKKELEKDFKIIMTRDNDEFISLIKRSKIANEENADLLISLHLNAHKNKTAGGLEIFYYSKKNSLEAQSIINFENSVDEKFGVKSEYTELLVDDLFYHINQEKSVGLANNMLDYLYKNLKMEKRGVFGGNLAVLRGSKMPSLLVELGFISNKNDLNKMKTEKYQKLSAQAMAKAIKKYFDY